MLPTFHSSTAVAGICLRNPAKTPFSSASSCSSSIAAIPSVTMFPTFHSSTAVAGNMGMLESAINLGALASTGAKLIQF
ncbi:hypothetical protein L1987_64705 [Smallanthus sonchifolius]|uniref:Uncharacterized protein n=1 Tax=Smallanthus sonchifolius TaxID=185202 RepID=A0ACB9BSB2_9ASTR|nr:hypothetical protein L1987_64705 [Smallanthus sonchifolius]